MRLLPKPAPRQQHGLAGTLVADRLPPREQNLHLVRSSDEGRHRLPDGSVEPADGRAHSHHAVRARRRRNALQIELAQSLVVEFPAGQPVDAIAHHDASPPATPCRRAARFMVSPMTLRCLAPRRQFPWQLICTLRRPTAGTPRDIVSTISSAARIARQPRPRAPGESRKGQDAIAQEPIDVTVIAGDAGLARVFILLDNGFQELGIDLQGQLRGPDQIAKQHRELAALAFRRHDSHHRFGRVILPPARQRLARAEGQPELLEVRVARISASEGRLRCR